MVLTYEELESKIKEELKERPSHHGWNHINRVIKNAEYLAEEEGADPKIARYAALLHDYVREPKHEFEEGSAEESSEKSEELLKETRLNQEEIGKVMKAVERHSRLSREKPESIEEKVVHDADKIEAVGTIGVTRYFLIGEELGWTYRETAEKYLKEAEKLINEGRDSYTETGRKIIRERYRESKRICEEMLEELRPLQHR